MGSLLQRWREWWRIKNGNTGKPKGVDFTVTVLTTGFWPVTRLQTSIYHTKWSTVLRVSRLIMKPKPSTWDLCGFILWEFVILMEDLIPNQSSWLFLPTRYVHISFLTWSVFDFNVIFLYFFLFSGWCALCFQQHRKINLPGAPWTTKP